MRWLESPFDILKPESVYEYRLQTEIKLTGREKNQEIVDICKGKAPDVREKKEAPPLTEKQKAYLEKCKKDMDFNRYLIEQGLYTSRFIK